MATTSDILREFLVAISWSYDEASRKKFVAAEQKTTGELEKENKKRDEFDRKRRESTLAAVKDLRNFATAAIATTGVVVGALGKMAEGFERAFYSSARTGSSVRELTNFKYAASQLGSSAEEAQAAVEGLAQKLRENPGYSVWLKSLGVSDPSNPTKSIEQLGAAFAKMPRYQAESIAQQFNISPNLLRVIMQVQELQRFGNQSDRKFGLFGFDPEKAARDGRDLTQSFRDLFDSFSKVSDKAGSGLFKELQPRIESLNKFLMDHGAEISAMLVKIGTALFDAFDKAVRMLPDLDKFVGTMGGWNHALAALAAVVSVSFVGRLANMLVTLRALSLLSTPPAWLLAMMGLGAYAGAKAIDLGVDHDAEKAGVSQMQSAMELNQHHLGNRSAGRRALDWVKGKLGYDGGSPTGNDAIWARSTRARNARRNAAGYTGSEGGSSVPIATGNFNAKAPGIAARLKADFNLTDEEAAAVLGNLGHESTGFTAFEEDHGRGPGRGWAQWTTRERRDGFFRYAQEHGLDPRSDEANYGYLRQELRTNYAGAITALKNADGLQDKTIAFERAYEGAGIKSYGSRMSYARAALSAMQQPNKLPPMARAGMYLGRHDGSSVPIPRIQPLPQSYLAPKPIGTSANDNGKTTNITHNPNITVNGVSDPTAAAAQVGARLDKQSSLLLRNVKTAVV